MESGNEVLIVEDNIATTNGLNGHSEDSNEMKTRSKASKNVCSGQERAGCETEKKEKKLTNKEMASVKLIAVDVKTVAAAAAATTGSPAKKGNKVIEELPNKKKTNERDDDSGINSRASSVSADDAPRMRTRSSRTTEITSTSTPAKKGQVRVPLSSYDLDDFDVTFEDPSNATNALKRKAATLYVEEMDEADEQQGGCGEPQAKRPALAATTNLFNAVLYPFKALRDKLYLVRETAKAENPSAIEEIQVPDQSVLRESIKENIEQVGISDETNEQEGNSVNTCSIM